MERLLEPELMDDEQQSIAYANADFSVSNQLFVDSLIRDFPDHLRHVVDIGCGPGDVMIRLARAVPSVHITAVDGSAPMLALAQNAVRAAALQARITLTQGYLPGLPLEDHLYDAITSKDLLHHLPDPLMLWKEIARLGTQGTAVYVMDLMRPQAPSDARQIVDSVAASDDPILREDFYRSLCAAFTPAEVQEQLLASGLDLRVQRLSDRHMLVSGRLR